MPGFSRARADDISPGELDIDNFRFLSKKDERPKIAKRKPGKRVLRDSPFKKTTPTMEKSGDSPVSTNSGFKRQLTSGSRSTIGRSSGRGIL